MFKGKYMYKWNNNGDIELESDEYQIGTQDTGVLNSQMGIEFTRKQTPIFTGVLNYFPDAIREVAKCSYAGQQQHNPDKPLAWDRSKSGDELDALTRHLLEVGTIDTDGIRHSAKVAWRALANLQKEIEQSNEERTSL
jgi:hypothetical protein